MDANLISVIDKFGTDDKCRATLEHLRWPEGVTCPECQSKKISRISTRNVFDCDSCRYQFSVTVGTIFNDTHLPLTKWFIATYIMIESQKGVSANQLKRMIGVSYKTAWYLCHRIRRAMTEACPEPLGNESSTVECDEKYTGGRRRYVGSGHVGNKTTVLGAKERGGQVRMAAEKRRTRKALHAFITANTDPQTERIHKDENPAYLGIEDADTKHETVNRHTEERVRGCVYTNSVENVWSLLKRSIIGSYHQVSAKHLDAYLDELEWRFNNRDNPYLFRDTLIRLIKSPKMEFKSLIEKSA